MVRPWMAATDVSGVVRSLQSRSFRKPRAMFWPVPAKEKPRTTKTDSTDLASVLANVCWIFFISRSVRSSVAPSGSWDIIMRTPWSSCGTSPVLVVLIR